MNTNPDSLREADAAGLLALPPRKGTRHVPQAQPGAQRPGHGAGFPGTLGEVELGVPNYKSLITLLF